VLFGTLAPLIYEAAGWGKISVGFPWFNTMFVSISPFLVLAMGIGPLARWKEDDPRRLMRLLWVSLALSLGVFVLAASGTIAGGGPGLGLGLGLAAWILFTHIQGLMDRLRHKGGLRGLKSDLTARSRAYYGMWLAHIGIAIFIVGATLVSIHGIETDVRMSPGGSHEIAGYRFQFNGAESILGPNYRAERGAVQVFRGERLVADLHPEKRAYVSGGMPMTEAAIDPGLTRDLYVSLGEPVSDAGDWSMRLYYKPYVRWIWLGGIFMALGGLLAMSDARYRSARRHATAPAGAGLARA